MNRTAKILATFGLLFGLGVGSGGCLVTAQGHMRGGAVVAYEAPPPDQQENVEVRAGFVWVRGHQEWRNGQWMWTPGHWERERSGYAWQDGRWEQRNGSWHWIEGQWVVGGTATVTGGGDYDRDRVRDHRGDNGYPPGGGYQGGGGYDNRTVGSTATNPDGSGVGVVVGNGQVTVAVHGPTQAPPPMRVESPGASRRGFAWINGYYEWRGDEYVWVPGHWERERTGQVWFDGRWDLEGNVYVWHPGEWRVRGGVDASGTVDRRTH
jgi:hypothetical protein